jgi:hypothetical protein
MGIITKPLTLTDVVIEAMPFTDELVSWCKKCPEFISGLKFANTTRFLALGVVFTSFTSNMPGDEVIGFLVYDMEKKLFKQDFIINIGRKASEFALYSKRPDKQYGKYSKHINEFYSNYGKNGHYSNTHHLTLSDIEAMNKPDLLERVNSTISIAEKIKKYGPNFITQDMLLDTVEKIRNAKMLLKTQQ